MSVHGYATPNHTIGFVLLPIAGGQNQRNGKDNSRKTSTGNILKRGCQHFLNTPVPTLYLRNNFYSLKTGL